jgi:hypothetical protein
VTSSPAHPAGGKNYNRSCLVDEQLLGTYSILYAHPAHGPSDLSGCYATFHAPRQVSSRQAALCLR